MIENVYRTGAEDVIYLAACMVNGDEPDPERVAGMDLEQLYKTANRHLLTCIVGYALEAADVHDFVFIQAKSKAIRKIVLFDTERSAVLSELEKAGIWYMPLKGSVLKEYYPQIGMRQMSDNDILYDASREDLKIIMEGIGFTIEEKYGVGIHDHYFKPPVCNFEMHRKLFGPAHDRRLREYYQDVKVRLLKDEDNRYGYHFSPEDFYIYMIAHEYKHFYGAGTGLRSLLDTYVYLRRNSEILDWIYIKGELEKLGIADFESQNRNLALKLFGDKMFTEDDEMLDYFISSGTYGKLEHRIWNKVDKFGGGIRGKGKYLLSRIFPPIESVEKAYPFFYRHKILLPFLIIIRIAGGLTVRRRKLWSELRALSRYKVRDKEDADH